MRTFKELILEAVGTNRSQRQFAADSGISRATLNRMLSDDYDSEPSKGILEKIADHSAGRVTVAMLKESLGLELTDEEKKDVNIWELPYNRRNAIMAEELRAGLLALTSKPHRYENIQSIFEITNMLYSRVMITTMFANKPRDIAEEASKKHNGAEKYANGYINWEDGETEVRFGCTFFLCETTGGGVVITDIAFDPKTLYTYKHDIALEIIDGLDTGDNEFNPDEYSITYLTTLKNTEAGIPAGQSLKGYWEAKELNEQAMYERLSEVADKEEMIALDSIFKKLRGEK